MSSNSACDGIVDYGSKFRFSIDRGGTFTDIYAEIPAPPGFMVLKLLSTNPDEYTDAPREGIRRILEAVTGKSIPKDRVDTSLIEWVRMGTTVATNALLEREGVPTVLVTTKGYKDVLRIGNQTRPAIFDLTMRKASVLYQSVIEVDERVLVWPNVTEEEKHSSHFTKGNTGEWMKVEVPLSIEAVRESLVALAKRYTSMGEPLPALAVVLMHSYTFTKHEKMVECIAKELGFDQISISSDIMPMFRFVPRGITTTVDAYLTPLIREYIAQFKSGFDEHLDERVQLSFMKSDGGLTSVDTFNGSSAILSGPAGGVVGYAMTTYSEGGEEGKSLDEDKSKSMDDEKDNATSVQLIGFDMGGTSTDVSRYAGAYEKVYETEIAGAQIQAPQLDITTVAAGGGSLLQVVAGTPKVGPKSAGAYPGPVCYGRPDGKLALTDANLFLGRIRPKHFPMLHGRSIAVDATRRAFEDMCASLNQFNIDHDLNDRYTPEELALGFVQVANAAMCRPIENLTEAKGYDPSQHILACFGGAGGQHACAIARRLGMRVVFIHRFAGILSAYGTGLADVVEEASEPCARGTECTLEGLPNLSERFAALEHSALTRLKSAGGIPSSSPSSSSTASLDETKDGDANSVVFERAVDLRFDGTDTVLSIVGSHEDSPEVYKKRFLKRYRKEYGFVVEREVVADHLRVSAIGRAQRITRRPIEPQGTRPCTPEETDASVYFEGGWRDTPVYLLSDMGSGAQVEGPAIIIDQTSTIVIEPHCTAHITTYGDIRIHVGKPTTSLSKGLGTEVSNVQLALFGHRFMGIAEQMGRTLQRTAISTNIKERLDFSCALFGPDGGLVANAPHLPVHLGAMQDAVRWQIRHLGSEWTEGTVILSNHPAAGGSHLPDMTVLTPVWHGGKPVFYVASRGHHADIGGITPGSMPPFSKSLAEEGAALLSFKLVQDGVFRTDAITQVLTKAGSRRIRDNISDLQAQVAANNKGITLVSALIEEYTLEVVQAYMGHVQRNAETAVREMLCRLSMELGLPEVGTLHAKDYLDDGSPIVLALTIDRRHGGSAIFDFTGTGCVMYGNLNAPRAVTTSAVIYALRCLVHQDIPLNQGCLDPVRIIGLEGTLLDPPHDAAVVGGNVLTSQRVTDVVLQAFQACGCSQGCMNNTTFGHESMGYYETIAGGSGAGPHWDGEHAVQSHMTNTRITDPEILERRYPVKLVRFQIREGSGGDGMFRGGDGAIREVEFLAPMTASILSERRALAPRGVCGGGDGARGCNLMVRASTGQVVNVGGKASVQVSPGDRFIIHTPGGGGYGSPVTPE